MSKLNPAKALVASLVAAALALTGCSSSSGAAAAGGSSDAIDTSTASGDVSYWLWDSNQQPAYQQCADAFHTANPNVTVKISQYGWDDYWTKLTTGFVAGTAPDVFTNHLSKYPEFITQGQLLALDDPRQGWRQHQQLPGRAVRSLGRSGRQAVRTAEGLRHRRDLLQQGPDQGRGRG